MKHLVRQIIVSQILTHVINLNPKIRVISKEVIILPAMANAVICPETGKSLKHHELITKLRYKIKWIRSTENEINKLYNTNTIRFIRKSNIPKGRKVTYGSFVVYIKDHKEEKARTRLTVGGDQIEYPGDKSTRTAGLTTTKNLINSVISTLGAKFLVIDINNFYLNTPSDDYNTWSSTCRRSLKKRSKNTTCSSYHKMKRCTSKFRKECTGYHRQVSSPTNYYSAI
jgi:hypothetical protein